MDTHAATATAANMVKPRMAMYIPHPLLPHAIDLDLTAKEALTTLEPVIADLGLEVACKLLLKWLVVATTKVAVGELVQSYVGHFLTFGLSFIGAGLKKTIKKIRKTYILYARCLRMCSIRKILFGLMH